MSSINDEIVLVCSTDVAGQLLHDNTPLITPNWTDDWLVWNKSIICPLCGYYWCINRSSSKCWLHISSYISIVKSCMQNSPITNSEVMFEKSWPFFPSQIKTD